MLRDQIAALTGAGQPARPNRPVHVLSDGSVVAGRSIEASTYVLRDEHRPLLREGDWSLDEYERARRANPPP
jgi:hypothetical protein